MNDSVLKQFTGRLINTPPTHGEEADAVDDHVCFGWQRGVKDKCFYLQLRMRDGSIAALPYMLLERIDFDPSEGITLRFTNQTVKIIGRNLNAEVRPQVMLLEGIFRNKVPWIQEADQPTAMEADKRTTIIEAIEF